MGLGKLIGRMLGAEVGAANGRRKGNATADEKVFFKELRRKRIVREHEEEGRMAGRATGEKLGLGADIGRKVVEPTGGIVEDVACEAVEKAVEIAENLLENKEGS